MIISGALFLAAADDDREERSSSQREVDREERDDDRREVDREERGDDHREADREYFVDEEEQEKDPMNTVNNKTYQEQCGTCHFAYQPALLPSSSWKKVMDGLNDHFGEDVNLEADSKKVISDYLKENGAENSSTKLASKIVRSLRGQTTTKITDIPYIQEKHHRIPAAAVKRKPVESLSNCIACHTSAASGIYDEDDVTIPR
jgi:cytochrome c5